MRDADFSLSQHVFISLLNPMLSIVLSAAFFALWTFRRENRYVARLVVCYVAVAIGFTLQSFDFGIDYQVSRLISNLFFFAAMFLFAGALLSRQGLAVPNRALIGCAAVAIAVMSWFLWVQPDFVARVIVVNYGLGAMCTVAVLRLRRAARRTLIDRLVVGVTSVRALDFFVRPLLVALFDSHASTATGITSPYWLTTSLATIVFSLLIALALLTAAALDTIEELQTESQTDPLSKLLNRRGFEQQGEALIDKCTARSMPLALILADLDHFKTINDNHGHAAGDAVIAAFGERLRNVMGPLAIAGRVGGEEFAILLPLADLGAARLFAETMRALPGGGEILPQGARVTASFGVAERRNGERLEALMRRADAALYEAKRTGRDCVRTESAGEKAVDAASASDRYAV